MPGLRRNDCRSPRCCCELLSEYCVKIERVQENSRGLTNAEIVRVVTAYIGVSGGYLNGFSYAGLTEFYPLYCELEIDPFSYAGNTTRERFISVLRGSDPEVQAKILRGLLERVPQPTASGPAVMTRDEVAALVTRLEGLPVPESLPENANETVLRALRDAQSLIHQQRPSSAVDRVHTALHGYLRTLCDEQEIAYEEGDSPQRLLRLLRQNHPRLGGIQEGDVISDVLTSIGTAVDRVNTIRNRASLAHPNEDLIDEPEARLVINSVRTILHYLEARTS